MHECPNCGKMLTEDLEICDCCLFDFNDTISCPYKVSNKCIHKNTICEIVGLNYELCSIYLHKSGITK